MRSFRSLLASGVFVLLCSALIAQVAPPTAPRPRVSPHETINAIVQGDYMTGQRVVIVYGRPYSKDPRSGQPRKIWGTLVPWGQVWRVGADEATLLVTTSTLQFGDLTVPAGAYTLYMLPVENGTSRLIINKMVGQWGLTYDEKQDLGRVDLKKEDLSSAVDQFIMTITPTQGGGGGTIKLAWENSQYSVPFTVKK